MKFTGKPFRPIRPGQGQNYTPQNSGNWPSMGEGKPSAPPPAVSGGGSYIDGGGNKQRGVYQDDAGNTDWSKKINEGIAKGDSYTDILDWYNNRNDKISSDPTLSKYANDATSQAALAYINHGRQQEDLNNEYARIAAEQAAAKRAGVDLAVGRLGAQKDQVGQSYADLFKQLYFEKKEAEKNLPQQMAAMGYTGGLTESSALGLATNYAEALRQGEQGRIGNLSDLDRAISETRLNGDISIAEQAAQLAQNKYNAYTNLLNQQREQGNFEKQFGLQKDELDYRKEQGGIANNQWQQSFDAGKEQTDWDRDQTHEQTIWDREQAARNEKKEQAVWMAGNGDFSALSALWNLTPEQSAAAVAKYAREQSIGAQQAAWELADNFAKWGDLSGLRDLGVDTSYQQQKQQKAVYGGSGSGGSGSGGGGKKEYTPDAVSHLEELVGRFNQKDFSPEVIRGLLDSGAYTMEELQASGYGGGATAPGWDARADGGYEMTKKSLDNMVSTLGRRYVPVEQIRSQAADYLDGANLSEAERERLVDYLLGIL